MITKKVDIKKADNNVARLLLQLNARCDIKTKNCVMTSSPIRDP